MCLHFISLPNTDEVLVDSQFMKILSIVEYVFGHELNHEGVPSTVLHEVFHNSSWPIYVHTDNI